MRFLKLIFSLSVCFTALLGDYVTFKSNHSNNSHVFRAVADSAVHASVGFLSSLVFFSHEMLVSKYATVWYIAFCTLLSSFIDVDHAIAAKSVNLKDMVNLKERPILHCTTLWTLISTILLVYSYIARKIHLYMITFMIIIAYTSHHIRDANRRGLWIYPFGHTAPIPKTFYVILLGTLPNIYAIALKCMEPKLNKNNIADVGYKMIV